MHKLDMADMCSGAAFLRPSFIHGCRMHLCLDGWQIGLCQSNISHGYWDDESCRDCIQFGTILFLTLHIYNIHAQCYSCILHSTPLWIFLTLMYTKRCDTADDDAAGGGGYYV